MLNAEQVDIDHFFAETNLPENLSLFSKQNNVHPFYQRAAVVLNLSHPEQWVETFGMTLLEGMEYGIPVIAPPVGGCTEFVESGVNGFQLDQRSIDEIVEALNKLHLDKKLYQEMSKNAKQSTKRFSVQQMNEAICNIVLGRQKTKSEKEAVVEI